MRREPRIGIGDSVRSVTPERAAVTLAQTGAGLPAEGGEPAGAGASIPSSPPSPSVAPVGDKPTDVHAVGPLDAEAGARRFDVQTPGTAADDQTQRTASTEMHPGITDFSRPAAPAPTAAADGPRPGGDPGRGVAPHHRKRGFRDGGTGAASRPRWSSMSAPRTAGTSATTRRSHSASRVSASSRRRWPYASNRGRPSSSSWSASTASCGTARGSSNRLDSASSTRRPCGRSSERPPFRPCRTGRNARPVPVSLRQIFDNPVIR